MLGAHAWAEYLCSRSIWQTRFFTYDKQEAEEHSNKKLRQDTTPKNMLKSLKLFFSQAPYSKWLQMKTLNPSMDQIIH